MSFSRSTPAYASAKLPKVRINRGAMCLLDGRALSPTQIPRNHGRRSHSPLQVHHAERGLAERGLAERGLDFAKSLSVVPSSNLGPDAGSKEAQHSQLF